MTAAAWSDGAAGPLLSLFDEMTSPDGSWQDGALCAQSGGDAWFPEKGERNLIARRVCEACPVRRPCLEYAMDFERGMGTETRHGIWAGLTPDERWKLDRAAKEAAA